MFHKKRPQIRKAQALSSPSSKDKKPADNTSAPGVENHKQESAVVDVEKKRVALTPVEPQKVRFRLFDSNFWKKKLRKAFFLAWVDYFDSFFLSYSGVLFK